MNIEYYIEYFSYDKAQFHYPYCYRVDLDNMEIYSIGKGQNEWFKIADKDTNYVRCIDALHNNNKCFKRISQEELFLELL